MNRFKNIIFSIIILILIFTFVFLLWFAFREILIFLKSTDSKLAAATILVGIIVTIYSQERIKKREIEEAHRESKIELYNKFIGFLVKIISGSNELTSDIAPTEKEMIDFMVEFKRDLLLRASPNVIKAQIEYEKATQNPHKTKNMFSYVDKLIREMRKDIGLSNFGLNNLETIQIFLKDKSEISKLK